jgi:hypothetical protein
MNIIRDYISGKNSYELICLTRFDIYFLKDFKNVDPNKFNIISILEKNNLIDDNLYIFPVKYLDRFIKLLGELEKTNIPESRLVLHKAKNKMHQIFDVNYLCNEYVDVPRLSFFKLRFFETVGFILNEFLYSENVIYHSVGNTSQMNINKNIIQFKKNINEPCGHAWIGYKIRNIGKYQLIFKIKSDKNIINFNFIKLHKPIKFIQTKNINAGTIEIIDTIIETTEQDDLMCFIFDTFNGTLDIEFSDINIIPITLLHNGAIIDKCIKENSLNDSNGLLIKSSIDNKNFEIIKNSTINMTPFQWIGYEITPNDNDIMMSFDIKFINDVPILDGSQNNLFAIKTHNPIIHYTEWLKHCIKNEYTNIKIPLHLNKEKQLIIFIMDEYFKSVHFIVKNINFTPIMHIQNIPKGKKIKAAILLAGEMRNYDNNEMMQMNNKNFYDYYDCDFFISTWDKRGSSPYHGTVVKKEYATDKITECIIQKTYKNVKEVHVDNFDSWIKTLPQQYIDIYNKGFKIQGTDKIVNCTVFPQLYKIWDANNMKKQYEEENNFKYDIVFRCRSDMCFIEEIPYTYMYDFYITHNTQNKIWTSNPLKIFYPKRIYDIFFYGDSETMDKLCDAWNNIIKLIENPYDNKLLNVDSCRVLYVECLINNIQVIDILRCIGDIYRDEEMEKYVKKILMIFN